MKVMITRASICLPWCCFAHETEWVWNKQRTYYAEGKKEYNVDSNYFHRGAMLGSSIKLPGTSWQKKINENTALTLLYLLMTVNGAKLEGGQDCWLADCHS